jgi:hypothetical protein
VVQIHFANFNRRTQAQKNGKLFEEGPSSPLSDRRDMIAKRAIDNILKHIDLHSHYVNGTESDNPTTREAVACYRIALDRVMVDAEESREILNAEYRELHPESVKTFEQVVSRARDIALSAAAQLLYFQHVKLHISKAPEAPKFGVPLYPELSSFINSRFPEAARLVYELSSPAHSPWEHEVAQFLRLRLAQAALEERFLDQRDPEGRYVKPVPVL